MVNPPGVESAHYSPHAGLSIAFCDKKQKYNNYMILQRKNCNINPLVARMRDGAIRVKQASVSSTVQGGGKRGAEGMERDI